MFNVSTKNLDIAIDLNKATVTSLKILGKERVFAPAPIFKICLINNLGDKGVFTAFDSVSFCLPFL